MTQMSVVVRGIPPGERWVIVDSLIGPHIAGDGRDHDHPRYLFSFRLRPTSSHDKILTGSGLAAST